MKREHIFAHYEEDASRCWKLQEGGYGSGTFLETAGYDCLELNNYEDGLRLRDGEQGPNILSAFFRKARQ